MKTSSTIFYTTSLLALPLDVLLKLEAISYSVKIMCYSLNGIRNMFHILHFKLFELFKAINLYTNNVVNRMKIRKL